jgi:hypothetical protein
MNMAKILRGPITCASIVCFAVALLVESAHAESNCLATEFAKEVFSKAGVPVTRAQVLLLALAPDSTVEPSKDQLTQTNWKFRNSTAEELKTEDNDLYRAQEFVRSMPPTESTQNCNLVMQKMRDDITKELDQRKKENIPEEFSPNRLKDLRAEETTKATNQHYTPNPMAGGRPLPPGRPPSGGDPSPGSPSGGAGFEGRFYPTPRKN